MNAKKEKKKKYLPMLARTHLNKKQTVTEIRHTVTHYASVHRA